MRRSSTWMSDTSCSFKVIMLGNAAVGKSSLVERFVSDKVPTLSATVGAEFRSKTVSLGDEFVKLQIWDTSGDERFRELLHTYYKCCTGAIVVYDIQCRESYEQAQDWVMELKKKVSSELVIVLAGNKADMDPLREIKMCEAEKYALHNNLIFLETSSVSGFNVKNCFMEIAKALYAQTLQAQDEPKDPNDWDSDTNDTGAQYCSCYSFMSLKASQRSRVKDPQ